MRPRLLSITPREPRGYAQRPTLVPRRERMNPVREPERSELGEGHVGIGELDHNDARTPRGHRERHARQEWSAKARNHSRVA
jgi:hypothetical protein